MMLSNLERSRTEREADLGRVGIPPRYWDTVLNKLSFRFLECGKEKVLPAVQRQALKQAVKEPQGQLICIGGHPTDEYALAAGYWVLRELRDREYVVTQFNLEDPPKRFHERTAGYLLHNLLGHATDDRVQTARNYLLRWNKPVRLVVVAACADPYTWCTTRLGLLPDICCRVVHT